MMLLFKKLLLALSLPRHILGIWVIDLTRFLHLMVPLLPHSVGRYTERQSRDMLFSYTFVVSICQFTVSRLAIHPPSIRQANIPVRSPPAYLPVLRVDNPQPN